MKENGVGKGKSAMLPNARQESLTLGQSKT